MRVAVLDYGAGNLHSLCKALAAPDWLLRIETDPRAALATDCLVLPGVGAFGAAARHLASAREALRDALSAGLPCLGICLGMQLLFERSEEGAGDGIGFLAGDVTRLRAARVPQIGWNRLHDAGEPLLGRSGLDLAYYANGYACRPRQAAIVTARSEYDGDVFPAVVRAGRTLGVQFHPEKSSAPGLGFVRAFLADVAARR